MEFRRVLFRSHNKQQATRQQWALLQQQVQQVPMHLEQLVLLAASAVLVLLLWVQLRSNNRLPCLLQQERKASLPSQASNPSNQSEALRVGKECVSNCRFRWSTIQ